MAIEFHGLSFLAYAATKQPLGATATIGRQNIHLYPSVVRDILNMQDEREYGPFCEELLKNHLGADIVDSFDASDFECASFVHDFNNPINHNRDYDTVVDMGTIEHVFNVPVALRNASSLCRPGGRIIHVLPANNFPGHGFWQFSPELFFSLYSESNGYSETEVYIAEIGNEHCWFKAKIPGNGVRAQYISKFRSFVLVLTRKSSAVTGDSVQQSDYMHRWSEGAAINANNSELRSRIKRLVISSKFGTSLLKFYRNKEALFNDMRLLRLSSRNKQFIKIPIASLLQKVPRPASPDPQ